MIACDTCVMSLALRRARKDLSAAERRIVFAVRDVISAGEIVLLEPVRQELLSGLTRASDFERLAEYLREMKGTPVESEDFERAAWCFNQCSVKGHAGGPGDMLICSLAIRSDAAIFTTDRDFERYAEAIPVRVIGVGQVETILKRLGNQRGGSSE